MKGGLLRLFCNNPYRLIGAVVALSILSLVSCVREDIREESGEANSMITRMNPNVLFLDTTILTNPVRTNGQVRFDIIGALPEIRKGAVLFYPGNGGIYGTIQQFTQAGSRLTLNLARGNMGIVWPEMVLTDTLSYDASVSRERTYPHHWWKDTLVQSYLDLFDGQVDGKNLKVSVTTLKASFVYNFENTYAGAGSRDWLRRVETVSDFTARIEGTVRIVGQAGVQKRDSLLVESSFYGPSHRNGIPVAYQVKTWLGYQVSFEKDTVVEFMVNASRTGRSNQRYTFWDGWESGLSGANPSGILEPLVVPELSGVLGGIFLRNEILPILCGEPALRFYQVLEAKVAKTVTLPQWNQVDQITFESSLNKAGVALVEAGSSELTSSGTDLLVNTSSGIIPNQRPIAQFSISPRTGFTNTNFEFNATGSSDLESSSDQLVFRWDFDSDNVFDTGFTDSKFAYHVYNQAGKYQVTLEVKDPLGLVGRKTEEVEVNLSTSAPIAHFNVSPENGRISTLFVFDASGCYDVQDPLSSLQVRWDFNGDGDWDTDFSTQKAQGYFFRNPGTYITKLEVIDTEGLSGSTTRQIRVLDANIKPTAVFKVDPQRGTTETLFVFDASGSSDPEDAPDLLRVRWDWDNDGFYDTGFLSQKTIQHRFSEAGTHTVVLEVSDTEGFAGVFSKEIVVTNPNTAPDADFTITPSAGPVGTEFLFDASLCKDLEDAPEQLEVRWDWDNDDKFDTEFVTVKQITRIFTEPGTYIIKVQVRDSGGLTDTKARLLVVQ